MRKAKLRFLSIGSMQYQAFGHGGYKEAGAALEFRVKGLGKTTKFADLLWRPRLLIETNCPGDA